MEGEMDFRRWALLLMIPWSVCAGGICRGCLLSWFLTWGVNCRDLVSPRCTEEYACPEWRELAAQQRVRWILSRKRCECIWVGVQVLGDNFGKPWKCPASISSSDFLLWCLDKTREVKTFPKHKIDTVLFISSSQSSGRWILGLVFSDCHAVGFDSPASTSVSIYLKASFTLLLCVGLLPGFPHPWHAPCRP